MLTEDNGILTKAEKSNEKTRGAEVKEVVSLAVSENVMTKYEGQGKTKSRQEVIKELHEEGKLTDEEDVYLEENNQITIGTIEVDFSQLGKVGSLTLVEMYEKAIEDNCTNENGECTNEEHLHIGDYVNYSNKTSGSYSVEKEVLGLNEWEDCPLDDKKQTYELSKNQLN